MGLIYRMTIAATLLLSACATPGPLTGQENQFSTQWHGPDRFTVSYRKNPVSSATVVKDLSLLRSAEIALENGFAYFVLVDEATYENFDASDMATALDELQRMEPSSKNRIIAFNDRPAHFHYVALFVRASIESRYEFLRQSESG